MQQSIQNKITNRIEILVSSAPIKKKNNKANLVTEYYAVLNEN